MSPKERLFIAVVAGGILALAMLILHKGNSTQVAMIPKGDSHSIGQQRDEGPYRQNRQIKPRGKDFITPKREVRYVESGPDKEHGSSIAGKVLDTQGRPILGANVVVTRTAAAIAQGADRRVTSALSDTDGSYLTDGIPPGRYHITAERDGYAKGKYEFITVRENKQITGLDFELSRGGLVTGLVSAPDGEPITVANVNLYCATPPATEGKSANRHFKAKTDKEGRFKVTDIPEGEYWINANHKDYLRRKATKLTVVTEEQTEMELVLDRGGCVTGMVTDEQGRPLEGVKIWIADRRGSLNFGKRCISQNDGRYLFAGVPTGQLRLKALSGKHLPQMSEPLNIEEGERIENVDFVLREGAFISGTVINEAGKLIAGAKVTASDNENYKHTTTDKSGYFRLQGLSEDGKIHITVRATGYLLLIKHKVKPFRSELLLILEKGGEVKGEIVGEGFNHYHIILYEAQHDSRKKRIVKQQLGRASQRSFRITEVPPGRYTVVAKCDGFIQAGIPQITVIVGAVTEVSIHLVPEK